jgi:hypothetical protein
MKRHSVVLAGLICGILLIFNQSQAVCPEEPLDDGICDTLKAEIFPSDQWIDLTTPPPYFARVSFYVTHDVLDTRDSICSMIFVMCYTHTNPAKYCSVTGYWNEIRWDADRLPRSIFRHLVTDGDTIHNWMMDEYEEGNGGEWNSVILDLDGSSHIWASMITTGSEDQRLGDASHTLLFTSTFRLEDTTTIKIDTCFWPVGDGGIWFNCWGPAYRPRINMPYYTSIRNEIRGDANGDHMIDITDVIYMINYLFRHGPSPVHFVCGDANCDDDLGILDVVLLINYLYKKGTAPGCF